ncbi:MAG: hypothetical protein ACERKZ_01870, partial [Lachnotalea sp.]
IFSGRMSRKLYKEAKHLYTAANNECNKSAIAYLADECRESCIKRRSIFIQMRTMSAYCHL